MKSLTKKAWWLVTSTWAVLIFNLSRAPYSSASSARSISKILDWLSISILPRNLDRLNNLLRKSSHLTEYAVLARISHKLSAADFAARWTVISSLLCPGKVENTPVDNCPRQRCPFRPSALLQTSQLETRVGPPASARILA